MCNNCVELMDHHCTFLGRSVGKRNYKFYFQFCYGISLLMTYAMATMMYMFYTMNVE